MKIRLNFPVLLGFALLMALAGTKAHAQQAGASVLATCGTATYSAGSIYPTTQDTTGTLCTSGGGGGGTVTANQGTAGSAAWPVLPYPSATSAAGVASVQSSAVETGHVIKASAGNLYNFSAAVDSTLSASAWAVMIFNSTTVPAAGAVNPVKCYLAPAGTTTIAGSFPMPLYMSTGISIAVSSGQTCFTKTDSAHGFISANAQ